MLGRRRGDHRAVAWSGPLEGLRYEDVIADLDPGWADWNPTPATEMRTAGPDEPARSGRMPIEDVAIAS